MTISEDELRIFSRQLILKEFSEKNFKYIQKQNVIIVGVGGIGCPIAQYLIATGIKNLTLYAFSTENWKRPDSEVNFLFDLIRKSLKKKIKKIIKEGIKVNIIGQRKGLPRDIIEIVKLVNI